MGAGASAHATPSSLNRLRKALVMRSYNIRKSDETLDELFRPHAHRFSGGLCISIEAIKKTLSENAPWVDVLFEQMLGDTCADLEFHSFIHFLETGNIPVTVDKVKEKPSISNKKSLAAKHGLKVSPPTDLPPSKKKGNMPPTPPRNRPSPSVTPRANMSRYTPKFDPKTSVLYPGVVDALKLHTLAIGIHSGALVPSAGLAVALDNKSAYRNPNSGPTKPLWRKREVVKQERTVEYTTVDADGVTQELTEKEVTTTEVLHMECRETGEFAHRETTNYEQSEVFNHEIVAEEKGNEEYIHMKSLDDEYEFLDSNMPKKEAPPEQDPGTPHTPFTPGGGGDRFNGSYQHSPTHIAEEKRGPVGDTPMHDLSISDDEADRKYEYMQDCSPNVQDGSPSSTDAYSRHKRNGSNNRFDESKIEEKESPSRGGLWESMGGDSPWVPPPNTDYESELLNDDSPNDRPPSSQQQPPVGMRRPDLFAPAGKDKARTRYNNNEEDDVNSVDGQAHEQGIESTFASMDERETSRRSSADHRDGGIGDQSESFEEVERDPRLDDTGETLQSAMFHSDSVDQAYHSPMFQPGNENTAHHNYSTDWNGGRESKEEQNILFTNIDSRSSSAKWGSEDDID